MKSGSVYRVALFFYPLISKINLSS